MLSMKDEQVTFASERIHISRRQKKADVVKTGHGFQALKDGRCVQITMVDRKQHVANGRFVSQKKCRDFIKHDGVNLRCVIRCQGIKRERFERFKLQLGRW